MSTYVPYLTLALSIASLVLHFIKKPWAQSAAGMVDQAKDAMPKQ